MQLATRPDIPTVKAEPDPPPFLWVTLQLTALAAAQPLTLMTGHKRALTDVTSVLLAAGLVALAAIAIYWVTAKFWVEPWKALALVSVGVYAFWNFTAAPMIGWIPSWVTGLLLYTAVVAFVLKYYGVRIFQLALFLLSMILIVTTAAEAWVVETNTPQATARVRNVAPEYVFESRPDVYFIVLDGYGRGDVLEDLFGFDNGPFVSSLESAGFVVPSKAQANYTLTHLSLASVLTMSYVHGDRFPLANSDIGLLGDFVAGANPVVENLKENGYHYVHAEAVNHFNTCGPSVDTCLNGPLIDTTLYSILEKTLIGGLLYPTTADPATSLNLTRIELLRNWQSFTTELTDEPIFAFVHLVLPHAPLFLDAGCDVVPDKKLGGRVLNDGVIPPDILAKRSEAWLEQTRCANLAINQFVNQLSDDDVVVITSDHGPDSVYTVFNQGGTYTSEQLDERFPTLTAVRLPTQCRDDVPDDLALVNIFRQVFSCLSNDPVEPLPVEHYVSSLEGSFEVVKNWDNRAD